MAGARCASVWLDEKELADHAGVFVGEQVAVEHQRGARVGVCPELDD